MGWDQEHYCMNYVITRCGRNNIGSFNPNLILCQIFWLYDNCLIPGCMWIEGERCILVWHIFSLGILPLDTECPGCAEYCTVPEYCLGKLTHYSRPHCTACKTGSGSGLDIMSHDSSIYLGSGWQALLSFAALEEKWLTINNFSFNLAITILCRSFGVYYLFFRPHFPWLAVPWEWDYVNIIFM